MSTVTALEAQHVLQTYKRQPVVLVRGEGSYLFDEDGKRYLDFISGIGVCVLGHGHPGLAARLAAMSGLQRTFFCNSGTEAVEACLKFARRYWYTRGERRQEFVALDESFHGRTFGSLSVTSDEHYRDPFEPLLPSVTFVKTNDRAALARAVSN